MAPDDPLDDPRAEQLDELSQCPKVVTGTDDHDVAISLRRGEDPEVLAAEIDGLEYADTEAVPPLGMLAQFDFVGEVDTETLYAVRNDEPRRVDCTIAFNGADPALYHDREKAEAAYDRITTGYGDHFTLVTVEFTEVLGVDE